MWIKSEQNIGGHPKTRRFARTLGISLAAAVGHLHLLWWHAVEYAPDGDLSQYGPNDIADAAMWEGDADAFLAALTSSGHIERTEGGTHISDWEFLFGETDRKRKARNSYMKDYMAARREGGVRSNDETNDDSSGASDASVRSNSDLTDDHVRSNAEDVNAELTPLERERDRDRDRDREKDKDKDKDSPPPTPPSRGGGVGEAQSGDSSPPERPTATSAPAEKPPYGGGARPQDGNGATGTGAALSLLPPGGTALEGTPDIAPPVAEAGGGMADGDAKTETGPKRPNDGPPGFRAFWAVYPRKVQKGPALKARLALSRQGVAIEDIAEAAREYAKASQAKGTPPDRILHPATFLHEDRWRDWLPPDGASYREALGLASQPRTSPPSRQGSGSIAYLKGLSRDEVDAILKTRPLYPQTGQSAVMGPSIDADSREIGA